MILLQHLINGGSLKSGNDGLHLRIGEDWEPQWGFPETDTWYSAGEYRFQNFIQDVQGLDEKEIALIAASNAIKKIDRRKRRDDTGR